MGKSNLPEINHVGEKLVEKWLFDNGYSSIIKEDIQLNETAFHATGQFQNILVKVKTVVHPNRPFKLSDYDIDILCRRGIKLNLVPYVAYLVIDNDGNLVGEITWERLSRKFIL